MSPSTALMEVYKQFMAGEPRPARGRWFRFRYWTLARLFVLGEWAGDKISKSKELTPLEQLYVACDISGHSPEHLRQKMIMANSMALDEMAKMAQVKSAKDGVVQ
jgi:hypothetical protein